MVVVQNDIRFEVVFDHFLITDCACGQIEWLLFLFENVTVEEELIMAEYS